MSSNPTNSNAPEARPFDVTSRSVLAIALPMTLAFMTTPLIGLTDTAIVGQSGEAAPLGGLAIGAIIFDFVFVSCNFLRAATTGLVAQSAGRGDVGEEQTIFWRALILALGLGIIFVLLAPWITGAGLAFMEPGADVRAAAETYMAIRFLSAPPALANYAILGFVLGRGEARLGLGLQVVINGANIALSLYLGVVLGWGIEGVAWGTVAAECIGAVCGFAIIVGRFSRQSRPGWLSLLDRKALVALMALNRDIMIRSLSLLTAFALFTRTGAQFGPVTLAANAVLLNFFMIAGFYLDGLATASEQIVGRSIGALHRPAFDKAIRLTVMWGFALSGIAAAFFLLAGAALIDVVTTAPEVREAARIYLPWAALTGLAGVLAFQMDGVFIGATWSRDMRNMMVLSLIAFVAMVWLVVPMAGNHGLWAAFNLFLGLRGISLYLLVPRRALAAFRQ